jgi:uncharacterized protein with PQ loop repeat
VTAHGLFVGVGYVGSIFGVIMVVPQIVRIVRHPSLPGVSPVSWLLVCLGCLCWLTYGVRTGSAPQVPGNALLVTGAIVVFMLLRTHQSQSRRALVLVGSASPVLAVAWLAPAHVPGFMGFSFGLVSSWPQLYDSIGSWRRRVTSGVSIGTWTLRLASQLCWLTFGLGTRDVVVVISAVVSLTTAATLLSLEYLARTSPAAEPAYAIEVA